MKWSWLRFSRSTEHYGWDMATIDMGHPQGDKHQMIIYRSNNKNRDIYPIGRMDVRIITPKTSRVIYRVDQLTIMCIATEVLGVEWEEDDGEDVR